MRDIKAIIKAVFDGKNIMRESVMSQKKYIRLMEEKTKYVEEFEKEIKNNKKLFILYKKVIKAIEAMHDEEVNYYFTEPFGVGLKIGMEMKRNDSFKQ